MQLTIHTETVDIRRGSKADLRQRILDAQPYSKADTAGEQGFSITAGPVRQFTSGSRRPRYPVRSEGTDANAMAARDRECKGGVGKFCREREALVAERRQFLDAAMSSVGQAADPQTDAATKLVAWISRGVMRPGPEDFAMLRLILLALLPQIGGMLLLIGRRSQRTGGRSL
jgi:hypothetical protein